MTLEAVPPGQQPTKITPNANSLGRENAHASPHARSGMTVNWARQPMKISFGLLSTIRKSLDDSVRPIPNIMTPRRGLMAQVLIQTKEAGFSVDMIATIRTIAPIHRAIKLQIFFIFV